MRASQTVSHGRGVCLAVGMPYGAVGAPKSSLQAFSSTGMTPFESDGFRRKCPACREYLGCTFE